MKRLSHLYVPVVLGALACSLAASARAGDARPVTKGEGFKFSDYYENTTQMKWLLECGEAHRQPDGRWQVTRAKYQTFGEKGEGGMVVEAPECSYDETGRTISSAGALHASRADGSFTIEGEGFLWQQTNSTLVVSNHVHTTLRPELFAPRAATSPANRPASAGRGIEVFSDQFEYGLPTGRGAYEGNVRVTGTNLTATAGRLVILLPQGQHRLQSLSAEQGVVVDYEQVHATGDRALYSEDTGLVVLKGEPTWRMAQRHGSGDELVFDQTNKLLRATGHARLQMPAASLGAASFLSQRTNSLAPTNEVIDVRCDNYLLQTNLAVFQKDVQVTDRRGDQVQGRMTCGTMKLTFLGTNQLEKLVAEQGVVIAQADGRFTAARAEYNGTNSLLDLTGNPVWQAGPREGKGDLIRMNLARQEMLVQGNALMRLPASEVGRSTLTGLGGSKPSRPNANLTGLAEITSLKYLVTPASALFNGGVRIQHPQMKWSCDELTMLSPPELGKQGRMLIAEPYVVFDVVDEQGRNVHGTGRKAVYTRRVTATSTNDIVRLTGTPAVIAATNIMGWNNLITLDLANHTIVVPGNYHFEGTVPGSATNLFRKPKIGGSG